MSGQNQGVAGKARDVLAAIEKIDVSYGLRFGQKHDARMAKHQAVELARQLIAHVAELEKRCRDAEAGIAVTRALRAALAADATIVDLALSQRA